MKVYVVGGTTGEYPDRCEWMVAAYTDEESAKQHVLAAALDYTGTSYWYEAIELHDHFEKRRLLQ